MSQNETGIRDVDRKMEEQNKRIILDQKRMSI